MSVNICGKRVLLRAVEIEDVDFMYGIENDIENWGVSGTTLPFSRYMLERFVEEQAKGIIAAGQCRFVVSLLSGENIGTVDLFEYDAIHRRAGVGILIVPSYRRQGYGREVLGLLHEFVARKLALRQLWCGVRGDNITSLKLFRSMNYQYVGVKRDWIFCDGDYCDEILLQYIFI